MVLRPYNHIKELKHEFSLRSHGFPSCDFLRLLLQEIFPLELRRKIFHTGNRLKLALEQKKKKCLGSVRRMITFRVISHPLPVVHI